MVVRKMFTFQSFDPTINSTGKINTQGVNRDQQLIIYNFSIVCLKLTFSDGTVDTIPPSWAKSWKKSNPFSVINYTTVFTLPILNQPVNILYGTIYEKTEYVKDVNTSMQFSFNVAG